MYTSFKRHRQGRQPSGLTHTHHCHRVAMATHLYIHIHHSLVAAVAVVVVTAMKVGAWMGGCMYT